MQVKEFAQLIAIWKVAEHDRSTQELRLYPDGTAYVPAMHTDAVRIGSPLDIDHAVAVHGGILSGIPPLLPSDKKITFRLTDSSLIVECGRRRAVLALLGAPDAPPPSIGKSGTLRPIDALRDAMPLLAATTAKNAIDPVTSGVRFRRVKEHLELMATDRSAVASLVKLEMKLKGVREDRIVPASDLSAALALLGDKVAMSFDDSHVVLRDETTQIRTSLLQGAFPDISQLPKKSGMKRAIALPREAVDVATRASALIDADRILTLAIKDKRGTLSVRSEAGGFRVPIGKHDVPDRELPLVSSLLSDAVGPLGKDVVLHYSDDAGSFLIFESRETGHRLWMAPIAQ